MPAAQRRLAGEPKARPVAISNLAAYMLGLVRLILDSSVAGYLHRSSVLLDFFAVHVRLFLCTNRFLFPFRILQRRHPRRGLDFQKDAPYNFFLWQRDIYFRKKCLKCRFSNDWILFILLVFIMFVLPGSLRQVQVCIDFDDIYFLSSRIYARSCSRYSWLDCRRKSTSLIVYARLFCRQCPSFPMYQLVSWSFQIFFASPHKQGAGCSLYIFFVTTRHPFSHHLF